MILLLLIIILIALIIIYVKPTEKLDFPFTQLTFTPQTVFDKCAWNTPYCQDKLGHPQKCPIPCQKLNPSCQYNFPVPVLSSEYGAYSPNKWCPGRPLC